MSGTSNQDVLTAFIARRHPDYAVMLPHWEFLQATYRGGRAWFTENIFKFFKEGTDEFRDRLNRAYRFNHTRETVDLVTKYLFKAKVERNDNSATEAVKRFWKRSTKSGMTIDQFAKHLAMSTSVFGQVGVVVDSKPVDGAVSVADEKKAPNPIYAYIVKPMDILDFALEDDTDGKLLWILIREWVRDDEDPLLGTGQLKPRFRLWRPHEWVLYEEVDAGRRGKVVREISRGDNPIGEIPVVFARHTIGESHYSAPALIDDTAYLDRAVANYLSNLDAIIQDQTFSQLVMPAQGILPGDDKYKQLVEAGTKRMFTYDGSQGGAGPEYISPDAAQAHVIIAVVEKIINEIYHTIGLAGERTKQDNAMGIDNSSGVAKAYDFERVNSLLNAKGEALENAENEIVRLVSLYASEPVPADRLVNYPETFDVATLTNELDTAERLAKIQAPKELRREHAKRIVEKLFPTLKEDLKKTVLEGVGKWLEAEPSQPGAPGAPKSPALRPTNTNPRQGQVTPQTGT
ncbi:hypothetical protein [Aureimonas sp. AU40]|uniref:hypothetical protein n=1 Tax=Aureimonas sp. AU40 TaxID=1637747 RepID=UPI0012E3D2F3|nr:hypothetical protein [Aureimonas sp. AU40]